jgi:predicted transcriptional regulator of viral defense system
MTKILKNIETPYIDAQTLLGLLADYRKPRDCIARMVKAGELIRLKNGFYLIAEKIQHGTSTIIPYEQVANMLYGPSYVSLEWALSFYGLIPERVYTVTSMTLGKDKQYRTPVGTFYYKTLYDERYSVGITQKSAHDFIGGFLIASPEKALADLVFTACPRLTKEELKTELIESKRINEDFFHQLDKKLLFEIAQSYRAKSVNYLLDLVGRI